LAKLQALQQEFDNLRNEISKLFRDFQDSLNQKADIEALQNLERLLLDRINELLEQLTKKFADKKDTKKALKLLEKQLKNLYDLFMSQRTAATDNEEDAMFTKKPLGGMSCASCEKNIINLHGIKADYTPWNRFPFRDPSERIAKVRTLLIN
jgi:DNA repair exonuclease SbcCD ATPase subunit